MLNYYIDIEKRKRIGEIDIYLDSPLALEATKIFEIHKECYDEETLKTLNIDNFPLYFKNLHTTSSAIESMALNNMSGIVIISSSGMCEAGRIKHHLKYNLANPNSSIVFVGFQAEGTLGRRIHDGEKKVKIFGDEIDVNAKIFTIPSLSGHADLNSLINWVTKIKSGVKNEIFITHGDLEASINLKNELEKVISTKCTIPDMYEQYNL